MDQTRHHLIIRTILVAEDTETDFYLLEHSFQDLDRGFQLTRARDGVEAMEYLAGEHGFSNRAEFPFPHLLLLDLQMPREDGFAVLQWMRSQEGLRGLPVVIFSSSAQSQDIRRAYDLGATSYIVKPMFREYAALVRTLADYWLRFNLVPEFSNNGRTVVQAEAVPILHKTK